MRKQLFVLLPLALFSQAAAARPPVLAGTVTDPDGRPLAGVMVSVETPFDSPLSVSPPAGPPTGQDGSFAIPGLPPVRLRVRGYLRGYLTESVTVCRRGEPVHLMLHPLDGTPRGPDGRPVKGPGLVAAVEAGCDEAGHPCPADPGADAPGCRRTISGWAFDGTTGAPLGQASVYAVGMDEVEQHSPTLDDGFFAFDMLPPGPVRLTIRSAGYKTLRSTIEPFSGELRLTAVLARDESCNCVPLPLSGRVTGPDGAPVERAWIDATDTRGVMSGADGSFELHPRSREPVTIWTHKDGFILSKIKVNPAVDRVDAIEIRLECGTVVKGRLLGLRRGELAYIRAEPLWSLPHGYR